MAVLFGHLAIGAYFTDNGIRYKKVSHHYAECLEHRVTFNSIDAVFVR